MNLYTLLALALLLKSARQHGLLLDPPSRSTAWREGIHGAEINYNDVELNCGGFHRQHVTNGGRCGVCGDPWDGERQNEAGGKYGRTGPTRHYVSGHAIEVKVRLTQSHLGWFEFRLCPEDSEIRPATQECLDRHILPLADGTGSRFHVNRSDTYWIRLQLPPGLACSKCLMQWLYHAGNSWGTDPDGRECLGCGKQEEFVNCADVSIVAEDLSTSLPVTSDVTALRNYVIENDVTTSPVHQNAMTDFSSKASAVHRDEVTSAKKEVSSQRDILQTFPHGNVPQESFVITSGITPQHDFQNNQKNTNDMKESQLQALNREASLKIQGDNTFLTSTTSSPVLSSGSSVDISLSQNQTVPGHDNENVQDKGEFTASGSESLNSGSSSTFSTDTATTITTTSFSSATTINIVSSSNNNSGGSNNSKTSSYSSNNSKDSSGSNSSSSNSNDSNVSSNSSGNSSSNRNNRNNNRRSSSSSIDTISNNRRNSFVRFSAVNAPTTTPDVLQFLSIYRSRHNTRRLPAFHVWMAPGILRSQRLQGRLPQHRVTGTAAVSALEERRPAPNHTLTKAADSVEVPRNPETIDLGVDAGGGTTQQDKRSTDYPTPITPATVLAQVTSGGSNPENMQNANNLDELQGSPVMPVPQDQGAEHGNLHVRTDSYDPWLEYQRFSLFGVQDTATQGTRDGKIPGVLSRDPSAELQKPGGVRSFPSVGDIVNTGPGSVRSSGLGVAPNIQQAGRHPGNQEEVLVDFYSESAMGLRVGTTPLLPPSWTITSVPGRVNAGVAESEWRSVQDRNHKVLESRRDDGATDPVLERFLQFGAMANMDGSVPTSSPLENRQQFPENVPKMMGKLSSESGLRSEMFSNSRVLDVQSTENELSLLEEATTRKPTDAIGSFINAEKPMKNVATPSFDTVTRSRVFGDLLQMIRNTEIVSTSTPPSIPTSSHARAQFPYSDALNGKFETTTSKIQSAQKGGSFTPSSAASQPAEEHPFNTAGVDPPGALGERSTTETHRFHPEQTTPTSTPESILPSLPRDFIQRPSGSEEISTHATRQRIEAARTSQSNPRRVARNVQNPPGSPSLWEIADIARIANPALRGSSSLGTGTGAAQSSLRGRTIAASDPAVPQLVGALPPTRSEGSPVGVGGSSVDALRSTSFLLRLPELPTREQLSRRQNIAGDDNESFVLNVSTTAQTSPVGQDPNQQQRFDGLPSNFFPALISSPDLRALVTQVQSPSSTKTPSSAGTTGESGPRLGATVISGAARMSHPIIKANRIQSLGDFPISTSGKSGASATASTSGRPSGLGDVSLSLHGLLARISNPALRSNESAGASGSQSDQLSVIKDQFQSASESHLEGLRNSEASIRSHTLRLADPLARNGFLESSAVPGDSKSGFVNAAVDANSNFHPTLDDKVNLSPQPTQRGTLDNSSGYTINQSSSSGQKEVLETATMSPLDQTPSSTKTTSTDGFIISRLGSVTNPQVENSTPSFFMDQSTLPQRTMTFGTPVRPVHQLPHSENTTPVGTSTSAPGISRNSPLSREFLLSQFAFIANPASRETTPSDSEPSGALFSRDSLNDKSTDQNDGEEEDSSRDAGETTAEPVIPTGTLATEKSIGEIARETTTESVIPTGTLATEKSTGDNVRETTTATLIPTETPAAGKSSGDSARETTPHTVISMGTLATEKNSGGSTGETTTGSVSTSPATEKSSTDATITTQHPATQNPSNKEQTTQSVSQDQAATTSQTTTTLPQENARSGVPKGPSSPSGHFPSSSPPPREQFTSYGLPSTTSVPVSEMDSSLLVAPTTSKLLTPLFQGEETSTAVTSPTSSPGTETSIAPVTTSTSPSWTTDRTAYSESPTTTAGSLTSDTIRRSSLSTGLGTSPPKDFEVPVTTTEPRTPVTNWWTRQRDYTTTSTATPRTAATEALQALAGLSLPQSLLSSRREAAVPRASPWRGASGNRRSRIRSNWQDRDDVASELSSTFTGFASLPLSSLTSQLTTGDAGSDVTGAVSHSQDFIAFSLARSIPFMVEG